MTTLEGWRAYNALCRGGVVTRDPRIHRFQSRYKMALQLETVIFTGMNEATAAAYTAALRVGLAYSAFETLTAAVPDLEGGLVIKNKELADSIRSRRNMRLHSLLLDNSDDRDNRLVKQIAQFLGNSSADCRPVAERIRHLTFHARLTATNSGMRASRSNVLCIQELANATLSAASKAFGAWVLQTSESQSQNSGRKTD